MCRPTTIVTFFTCLYEPIVNRDHVSILIFFLATITVTELLCWTVNSQIRHIKALQVLLYLSWYDGTKKYGVISTILLIPLLYYGYHRPLGKSGLLMVLWDDQVWVWR